jgi:NitT/TauT family transport system substrate-binding protein
MYAAPAFIEKNPLTVQALVNAFVRGLAFMQSHSPEEIAALVLEDYALGDKPLYVQAIKNSLPMYSPDGRFAREGAETAYNVLKAFDPDVRTAKIDLAATYTDRFVEKAQAAK